MKAPIALALAATALAGCSRPAPLGAGAGAGPVAASASDGYRRPPQARAAARAADGGVILSGVALAGAMVRLASPDGHSAEVAAEPSGAWSLAVPGGGPAIYGLSQTADGQKNQAEGYIAVLPAGPITAVELRSGAGALVLASGPARPALLAVDIDGAGVAVVSGWALPGQALRVLVDGAVADEGTAGADGRFALSLPKPLAAGARTIQVLSPTGADQEKVEVGPPPAFTGVWRPAPHGQGWRLDWMTPAGGVQTTELFAPGSQTTGSAS